MTRHTWLIGLLVIAFLMRAAVAIALQTWLDQQPERHFLIEGDANGYWELGEKMARGDDYAIHQPPRYVLRMPGFPAVLAVAQLLPMGHPFLTARILLAVIGTATCALVYFLSLKLLQFLPQWAQRHRQIVALLATGYCVAAPVLLGFSVVILSETLFALALLLSLLCGLQWINTFSIQPDLQQKSAVVSQYSRAAVTGVVMGLACYVRPSWILFAPLLALLVMLLNRQKRHVILQSFVMLLCLVLTLLPWGIRNHQVTGHVVLTTLWDGPSLYDALNPRATGASDMTFFTIDQPELDGMSEYEINQHYRQKAWQFVQQQPGRVLQLAGIKFLRFWSPVPNTNQFASVWIWLAMALWYVPLIVFAIVGCWQNRSHIWLLFFTAGPIVYFTLIHMVFIGSLRYRLPAEYPLAIIAAAGGYSLWKSKPCKQ